MSKEIQEAYREGYKKGYLDGFSKLQKVENESVDARKDDSQANIPLNDIRAEIGDIKDTIVDLETRVYILERKAKL